MGGGELSASELAFRAGASRQSMSGHLAKLSGAGLIRRKAAGRQRLFQLASADVSHAVEALAAIAPPKRVVALHQQIAVERLREARSCYDHLAGRLGVALTERFIANGEIRSGTDGFLLTAKGEDCFRALGIDLEHARSSGRNFARACMDWSERRPHLAGSLGAHLLQLLIDNQWLARYGDRALRVTPDGRANLERRFGVRV
jgi:DNA-binding transcriptional ArsR family regulator